MARIVKEGVSDTISSRLNDPRITGFVSITRVEMAADLRTAEVYLSIFGGDEATQKKTFLAIMHAKPKIQSLLGGKIRSKFCPVLRFHMDDKLKKTLETMNLIDQAVKELEKKDSLDEGHE